MKVERVNDVPLLLGHMQQNQLGELIDKHFGNHGNLIGARAGTTASVFLAYILSEGDHRLSYVEEWATELIATLRKSTGNDSLDGKDFTDDRLGALLDKLSDEKKWDAFESAYNQGVIRVFDLAEVKPVTRIDAFIVQSHREAGEDFQFGFSKQHRSDLPQLKVMAATLDPLAMPLCSVFASGNTPDDGLYLPVLKKLFDEGGDTAHLFVGDSKMGSAEVRKETNEAGHYYLMPLNRKQLTVSELSKALEEHSQSDELRILEEEGKKKGQLKVRVFEQTVEWQPAEKGAKPIKERRIFVYSVVHAKKRAAVQENKISIAEKALQDLFLRGRGRRPPKTPEGAQQKIAKILKTNNVEGLLQVELKYEVQYKNIRGHLEKPARREAQYKFELVCWRNEEAIKHRLEIQSWQVYACNAPKDYISTKEIVLCYRNNYRIEHKFDELLNRLTALMPVYLHKQNRVRALVRLLLLGLKITSVIEYKVRATLKKNKGVISELYPGNPNRKTEKPTIKYLLRAFRNVSVVTHLQEGKNIRTLIQLNELQQKILDLAGLDKQIYLIIANESI